MYDPYLPDVEVAYAGTNSEMRRKGIVPVWSDLYPGVGVVHLATLSNSSKQLPHRRPVG